MSIGPWAASAAMAAAFVAVVATSPPTASTTPGCPAGESEDFKTGVCFPKQPTDVVEITTDSYGGLPEVDGVRCTGHNSYECIGLADESQAAGPTPSPHSTFSGEATPSSSESRPAG